MDSAQKFQRLEDRLNFPMILATLALLAIIIIKGSLELTPFFVQLLNGIDFFIWILFILELIVLTYYAPDRGEYLRSHWYNVLIIFLPFFRVFRLVHLGLFTYLEGTLLYIYKGLSALFGSDAQLARVFPILVRGVQEVRDMFKKHRLNYLIYIVILVVVFLGGLVTVFERTAENANIQSLSDGVWWSIVSISTVGYGDKFPVTPQGRLIGLFLITSGVVLFSLMTANIASKIIGDNDGVENKVLKEELDRIEKKLNKLDKKLNSTNL